MSAHATRRHLVGASAAALVLFGAAGAGKAAELDGTLLAMAADLDAVQARFDVRNAAANSSCDSAAASPVGFWPLADAIAETPARTPEGIAAKARVLRLVHRNRINGSNADKIAQHALGLVRDLVGEG